MNHAFQRHRGASVYPVIALCLICFLAQNVSSGKIRVDLLGVELTDYRFGLGDPYVKFYERENFRGKIHFQLLGKKCTNLPPFRQDWASSVDVQMRCITVCEELNCGGKCARIFPPDISTPDNKGARKLQPYGMNDKIKSVKFCYS